MSSHLSATVLRNLSDRAYDKRKSAALEIESKVKEIVHGGKSKDRHDIETVLTVLSKDYAMSAQSNFRKGGLIGLAAASLGLGSEACNYLNTLLPPVLACFTDQDPRVRYYACEALYNMAKVSRSSLLGSFNGIFEGLARLCSDIDAGVKNAAHLLDGLLMDIVAESNTFNLESFVPVLNAHLRQKNSLVRHFLLGWITALLKRPGLDMVKHSPQLLDGLMAMLADSSKEIRSQADAVIECFLRGLEEKDAAGSALDYSLMMPVLIKCASYKVPSDHRDGDTAGASPSPNTVDAEVDDGGTSDKSLQLGTLSHGVSLQWIRKVLELGKDKVMGFTGELVPLLLGFETSGPRGKTGPVKSQARLIALQLRDLIRSAGRDAAGAVVDYSQVLGSVMAGLRSPVKEARIESLEWIELLMEVVPPSPGDGTKVGKVTHVLPMLLKGLQDTEEDVVKHALAVVTKSCAVGELFSPVMLELMIQFRSDRAMLQERGGLIIRQLCLCLGPKQVFLKMAELLEGDETDLDFAEAMTDKLSLILLTAPEANQLRQDLVDDNEKAEGGLFQTLYACWCYCPVAAISLCLLAQEYAMACRLASAIGLRLQSLPSEETIGLLVQLDRLVQLIEAPLFVPLRMHLIEPARHPHLVKALFTILMVLPQSEVFETLRKRLKSVPTTAMIQLYPADGTSDSSVVDCKDLESVFEAKAKARERASRERRVESGKP